MAIFLGVHKFPAGMEESQVKEGFGKYKESARAKGLRPIGAIYSMEKSFAYCQTEAESAEQVWQAHKEVAIPLEDVIEVKSLS